MTISWIFLLLKTQERTGIVIVVFTAKSASALVDSFDVLMSRLFADGAACFKNTLRSLFLDKTETLSLI